MIRAAGIVAASLALLAASSAQALTLEQVGGKFDQPTYVTSDPGDAGRLFVAEREGTIKLVEGGTTSVFVDLSSVVNCCAAERGLMSIALDPHFDATGRLYVDYTGETEPGEIRVAELVAAPDRKSASPATLNPLLTVPHPGKSNHNGGQIQFGPDGDLYVSTGDGGGNNDELHNAQNPASKLGKLLRLDPDSVSPAATTWSSGLRNPFRFSFDSLRGDLVIADVGEGAREEIDFAPSPAPNMVGGENANYGWNCREGLIAGPATDPDPECATPPLGGYTDPVFDYPHAPDPDLGGPKRCSIIGGYVVRDLALGALYGRYLYSDYCGGGLRSLQLPASADGHAGDDCSLGLKASKPVSFGEDAARRLYLVEESGGVYRLVGQPPAGCPTLFPQQPATTQTKPSSPTFIGIKAQRRRVERGKRALLTVWVSPCGGRKGETVELMRNGHRNGSRFLSRACTARFLPKIHRGTTFTAVTREKHGYLPGKSRRLKIRLAHHKRH